VHLVAPVQDIDAFLGGDDRVAVKIGGPLLEFGEILMDFKARWEPKSR
jgi:hypothetical protein